MQVEIEQTADALKARVCEAVEQLRPVLIGLSHEIHANPELRFQEFEASRRLAVALEQASLEVVRPAYGLDTSFSSEFGNASGPCVGILAEYDALPNIGHACGHNIIGTASVGAAIALSRLGATLPGRIRVVGTPAEEGGGGKVIIGRNGAFDGLFCAMMVHPAAENLPTFSLISRATVDVSYHGRPAHAAAEPEAGINALDGLVTAYASISNYRQQMPQGARIHGIVTSGGDATNVIPAFASGQFAVRAPTRAVLSQMKQRLEACFQAGALASGARVQIEWHDIEYYELRTNWAMAEAFRANATRLGRSFASDGSKAAGQVASSDIGNVSHMIPVIHPMIKAVPEGVAFHTAEFASWAGSEMGDAAVIDGAKSLAMTAVDVLTDERLRERINAEFAAAA